MTSGNISNVNAVTFDDDGIFPNSVLPVLIYEAAQEKEQAGPEAMEQLFEGNGWPPQWRAGIYDYHHYHSTAHECLGIARGNARIMLGGPQGREFDIASGDVVVIPAGVAHRRLSASADFLVVGAYPPSENWDLLRGEVGERPKADDNIGKVPLPTTDPVGGDKGPLMEQWR